MTTTTGHRAISEQAKAAALRTHSEQKPVNLGLVGTQVENQNSRNIHIGKQSITAGQVTSAVAGTPPKVVKVTTQDGGAEPPAAV